LIARRRASLRAFRNSWPGRHGREEPGSTVCTIPKRTGIRSHRERTGPALRLTREDLRILADAPDEPSVSCFLPTHRHPPEKREDRTRFKNLLDEAEERLVGRPMRRPEVRRRLEPARTMLEDEPFWETTRDGLAVFISPSMFRAYSTSMPFREFVEVGDRFHLKPLLPVLRGDGRFFLLALSQKQVAFLEGTSESLVEVPVPHLPKDLASALHLRPAPPGRPLESRSQFSGAGRGRSTWHGHGEEMEREDRLLLEYFHSVDHAVAPVLRGETAPLVLAAVDYHHPLYAQVNSYPRLISGGVLGNPEAFHIEDLHRRSWGVVEEALKVQLDRAVAEYGEFAGGPRSSQEVSTVLIGAAFARVARLFVAQDVELWGRFDPESLELTVHPRRQAGDVDLLDWAAVRTIATDGVVHVLPLDRVPGGGPIAALFRF
jgi:hypothetical protein